MFPNTRDEVARFGVGLALAAGVLGLLITFVPGGEAWWFGATALLAALGLLSPIREARLLAGGLVVAFAGLALAGYYRGVRYQEWQREERPRIEEFLRKRGQPNSPPHRPAGD